MSKIFLSRSGAPDELLGHVDEEGRVLRSKFGPDVEVGHVDLPNGRVYASRVGPDQYIGRVRIDSGRVYRHKAFVPDRYVGQVRDDGQMYLHRATAPDKRVGQIDPPLSKAHAGAAFLLLIWPELERQTAAQPAAGQEEDSE